MFQMEEREASTEILDSILREFLSSFITSTHTPSSTKDSSDSSTPTSPKVMGSGSEAAVHKKGVDLEEQGLGEDSEWWILKWKGWKKKREE